MDCRPSPSIRVTANAKMEVNTTRGSTLSSAAAAIALVGIRLLIQSCTVGTDAAVAELSTLARPARSASVALAGSGNASSSAGINNVPTAAELVSTITNQSTDRAAMRPALAWSAPDTTPVISSAMISGMTVIFSPSSQRPPTVDAIVISVSRIVAELVRQNAEQQPSDQRAKDQPGCAARFRSEVVLLMADDARRPRLTQALATVTAACGT